MFYDISESVFYEKAFDTSAAIVNPEDAMSTQEKPTKRINPKSEEKSNERFCDVENGLEETLYDRDKKRKVKKQRKTKEPWSCSKRTNELKDENGVPLFLECVCGKYPQIIKARGVTHTYFANKRTSIAKREFQGVSWMLCCINCGIRTDFFDSIHALRSKWNRFALYGQCHADKDENEYVYTFYKTEDIKNGVMKLPLSKKRMGELELFYFVDGEYMTKIHMMLKPGMAFTNYAELCLYLNENPETLSVNIARHKEWWSRFFEFKKMGASFFIRRVYKDYLPWSKDDPKEPNAKRGLSSFMPKQILFFDGNTASGRDIRGERTDNLKSAASRLSKEEYNARKKKIKDRLLEKDEDLVEYEIFEEDEWEEASEDYEDDVGDDCEDYEDEAGEDEEIVEAEEEYEIYEDDDAWGEEGANKVDDNEDENDQEEVTDEQGNE